MPFYKFICRHCNLEIKKLLRGPKDAEGYSGACHICGHALYFALGKPDKQAVETVDEDRGKKSIQGIEKMIDERASEHFKKHELPRLIEKEGLETAIQQGWVDETGNIKQ